MEDNKNIKMPPKRRMGPPGRGMAPVEKAKDFKGSIGKLIRYIGSYKIAIIFVAVMAVCSTVFSVVGPKVLGKDVYKYTFIPFFLHSFACSRYISFTFR